MLNILVTGTGGGVGQGIIKSLRMIEDLEIKIFAVDMSSNAAGLYSGDIAYLVPACSSEQYLPALADIFKKESIDYYFPGTDLELKLCAKNKAFFDDKFGVKTVISSLGSVEIADSKYKTYSFLKEHGFTYPETTWLDDVELSSLDYPVIIKPDVGCRSIGVFRVNNEIELRKNVTSFEGVVVQELVGDDESEYTCTVVKHNNSISPVLVLKRTLRAGDTFRAEPIKNLEIEEWCNIKIRNRRRM